MTLCYTGSENWQLFQGYSVKLFRMLNENLRQAIHINDLGVGAILLFVVVVVIVAIRTLQSFRFSPNFPPKIRAYPEICVFIKGIR